MLDTIEDRPDYIVLDPPRDGIHPKALEKIINYGVDHMIYISCKPTSLARDLEVLLARGYVVDKVQCVDMFPNTVHVETVVLLSHKKADSYIHIDVEFGEGEGKIPVDSIAKRAEAYKPKEKVTYKMIKEYIEAKYGFKVHTAYIAEVKRNLGLPMYDAPNAVEELKQPRKHPTPEKVEAIKDALRYFAVDDLSFCTYRGEVFGLLGPNGAGKTTTLRMLATLIKPDKGDALIDGSSIVTDPNGVRKKIGFLTSELKLEEFFTPNYLFDFFSELYGVDQAERDERKRILFQKFGVDEFAEVKVANLSTGMKQKVSLIISLVHDPQIIIFDEPTNGLDVITAKVVTDFMQELKAEGKTIIVSTHIFSLIEKICDRVGIIINGKMVLCDTLSHVTAEMPLEDKFFEIYRETAGEIV